MHLRPFLCKEGRKCSKNNLNLIKNSKELMKMCYLKKFKNTVVIYQVDNKTYLLMKKVLFVKVTEREPGIIL